MRIGCTVCEIFAFKLYCDLETGVRGHSRRSSKVVLSLFDRAHTTLYSSSIITMSLDSIYYPFRDIAAIGILVKSCHPLYLPAPVGGEAVRFTQRPLVTKKTKMMGLSDSDSGRISNFDYAFSRFDIIHACDRRTDGIAVAYTRARLYSICAVARKNVVTCFFLDTVYVYCCYHNNKI